MGEVLFEALRKDLMGVEKGEAMAVVGEVVVEE